MPSAFHGQAKRHIAPVEPRPGDGIVRWNGDCKDGFAEGSGILTRRTVNDNENDKLPEDPKIEAPLVRGKVKGEVMLTIGHVSYV